MPASFDNTVDVTLEIGFASDPTVALGSTVWTDVTEDLMAHETQSPSRQYLLDRFEGGRAAFLLDNRTGAYDPNNGAGPHFGSILPFKRVRFSATTGTGQRRLWAGYAQSWTQQWPQSRPGNDGIATTELRCVDATRLMELHELPDSPFEWVVLDDVLSLSTTQPQAWYRFDEPAEEMVVHDSFTERAITSGFDGTYERRPPPSSGLVFKSDNGARQFTTVENELPRRAIIPNVFDDYPIGISALIRVPPHEVLEQARIWTGATFSPGGVEITSGVAVIFSVTSSGDLTFLVDDGTNQRQITAVGFGTGRRQLDDDEIHVVAIQAASATDWTMEIDGVIQEISTTTVGTGAPDWTLVASGVETWVIGPLNADTPGNEPYTLDEIILSSFAGALSLQLFNVGHVDGQNPAWGNLSAGNRLTEILTDPDFGMGFALADLDLDDGNLLGPHTLGGTVLDYANRLAETEFGGIYVLPDGVIRFRDRLTLFSADQHTVSQATFGDGVGELPYVSAEAPFDESLIRNNVVIARDGGAERMAKDETSIDAFGNHGFSLTSLIHQNDAISTDRAHFTIQNFAQPQQRIDALEIRPQADPSILYDEVFDRALEDRITTTRRPPGGHTTTIEGLIQGIRHRGTAADRLWVTEYQLTRVGVAEEDYWLIGVVGRSEIGETTVVGF